MIRYTSSLDTISADNLVGFFVGWPNPPSSTAHMRILGGSYAVWLAVDDSSAQIVGYITAVSDGTCAAYIPLLEVLPAYQSKGIGSELVRRMLDTLSNVYMIDLLCDESLQQFYAKHGMVKADGMMIRNYARQSCADI